LEDSLLPRSILLIGLLAFSAFFSACEAAFFSLNPLQLSALKEKKGSAGQLINSLLEKPRDLLITIYIGNELVNIATSVVVTTLAISLLGNTGVGVAIGVGTFLLLIFGEVIPKSLSLKGAESYVLFAVYPLKFFSDIVQPIRKLFTRVAERFLSCLGLGPFHLKESAITDEEFKTMVRMSEGEGALDADESALIHNVIEFGETMAADIMTPKIEIFTLKIDDTLDTIFAQITQSFYSRVPVYDKDGETIAGILYTKDLLRYKHLSPEKFNLKSILRPSHSVPKSKKIKELLDEFRRMKRHVAIVLDEYGSLCGLVTLEDILEELVGEIDSEMRKEEDPLVRLDSHTYRLSATYSLYEFNETFGNVIHDQDHDTIGGFVFGLFGRVPRSGETVTYENLKFRVEKMRGARILKLHLTVLNGFSPVETEADKIKLRAT